VTIVSAAMIRTVGWGGHDTKCGQGKCGKCRRTVIAAIVNVSVAIVATLSHLAPQADFVAAQLCGTAEGGEPSALTPTLTLTLTLPPPLPLILTLTLTLILPLTLPLTLPVTLPRWLPL
jgi:hypothetical protein